MSVHLPSELLPADGRFGSGPSKVRRSQIEALASAEAPFGQSHRSQPVRNLVGKIRADMAQLFEIPDGYEVVLGNGGASLMWDAIAFTVAEKRVQAAVFGEFSSKAATACTKVPWIDSVEIASAVPGSLATCESTTGIDTYLYPHNETATGVMSPVSRFGDSTALTVVDATSAAGGVLCDVSATDIYYFSLQKCFGADGGLWAALVSPRALERIEKLSSQRWIPDVLNLQFAVDNSRKDQTLNTPAIGTLVLVSQQLTWMAESGGLPAMDARTRASSDAVYSWAEKHALATPFVENPAQRSQVVTTIDFDESVNAKAISSYLRNFGIFDIDSYRSLNRNQLRIATFPNVEKADVEALLACIDWTIEHVR